MSEVMTDIKEIKEKGLLELSGLKTVDQVDRFRSKYLGRKGLLRHLTTELVKLSDSEKRVVGQQINQLKQEINAKLSEKEKLLGGTVPTIPEQELFDITLPGTPKEIGHKHPVYETMNEICRIFTRLGFEVVSGPEIETEYNNFDALNIPKEHPSRDAFDTFYLEGYHRQYLLRSHTSPAQIRVMKNRQPPIAVIVPGKTFRADTPDASHFPMFHQVEGLMVNTDISLANLKGILDVFVKEIFGKSIKMRFRPSFFPFVEPGAEVDISCVICGGKGENCSVCKGEGWLEILGAGMVHPNVFKAVGYDSDLYTGFAFGMGVERIAMLKYQINDIRLFTENHLHFLSQF